MERVEVELLKQSWNLIVPRSRTRQVVARYGEERGEVGRQPPDTLRRHLILIGLVL